jgi:hypothetical protein
MERFFKVLFHWRVRVDGATAFSLYDCLVGGDLERSAVESEYLLYIQNYVARRNWSDLTPHSMSRVNKTDIFCQNSSKFGGIGSEFKSRMGTVHNSI